MGEDYQHMQDKEGQWVKFLIALYMPLSNCRGFYSA